jgi:hypothetical protein
MGIMNRGKAMRKRPPQRRRDANPDRASRIQTVGIVAQDRMSLPRKRCQNKIEFSAFELIRRPVHGPLTHYNSSMK